MSEEKQRRRRRRHRSSEDETGLAFHELSHELSHGPKRSRVSRRLKLSIWLLIALNFVVIIIGGIALLADSDSPSYHPNPVTELHRSNFQKSIEIAAHADADRVSHILMPIEKSNTALQWQSITNQETGVVEDWIKVVVWVSEAGYKAYYAELEQHPDALGQTPPNRPVVWVSLVPQVRNFCTKLTNNGEFDVSYRLKQYLGLNPERRYERFVELWVNSENIFRPCPDPETNDRYCNLDIDHRNLPKVKNVADYPKFLRELKIASYNPDGAPWTRLGYTYDWAPGETNVGASEYMLVPDANYKVAGSHSTDEYCGWDE